MSSGAASRSRVTWKQLPLSRWLETVMVPPISSTMYLVMAMPRPVPSVRWTRALSSRAKESKIFFWNSSDMPMPVSWTMKWVRMKSPPRGESFWETVMVMLPSSGVNFMALERRFSRTWLRRTPSQ